MAILPQNLGLQRPLGLGLLALLGLATVPRQIRDQRQLNMHLFQCFDKIL